MPLIIDKTLVSTDLLPRIQRLWELSASKILDIERTWPEEKGTPVFTINGIYASRGWTEWTGGFQHGSALLQFDATGERRFLDLGRTYTRQKMAIHISHTGVHDHGFNNISTYGNLHRLMREGRLEPDVNERQFYELALKVSGAIQAARWTPATNGLGYIYSFNGPHSLFIDTMRSLRSLIVASQLGHVLMGEQDSTICLLERAIVHAEVTARFNIYYGEGRDSYDVPGRVAHESLFNVNDGSYRCPSSQQGFSPFTTWTRGLAWAVCGFAELLEYLLELDPKRQIRGRSLSSFIELFLRAARTTAEFYMENCCSDGVPYWDTGAPELWRIEEALGKPAQPFNAWEPVDSSAAAIAAQGLLRLSRVERVLGNRSEDLRLQKAGMTVARTLFSENYLSESVAHQGLLLHSVYHRPNGWDHVAPQQKVPNGESSMWGDYHLRELALMIQREARQEAPYQFF